MCVLLKCFVGLSVETGNFDPLCKKKQPIMENKLPLLNLTSPDCQEKANGSPKKKQRFDDEGIKFLF